MFDAIYTAESCGLVERIGWPYFPVLTQISIYVGHILFVNCVCMSPSETNCENSDRRARWLHFWLRDQQARFLVYGAAVCPRTGEFDFKVFFFFVLQRENFVSDKPTSEGLCCTFLMLLRAIGYYRPESFYCGKRLCCEDVAGSGEFVHEFRVDQTAVWLLEASVYIFSLKTFWQ